MVNPKTSFRAFVLLMCVFAFLLSILISCEDSAQDPETENSEEVSGETNQEEADDYTFDTEVASIVLNGNDISVSGNGVTTEGSIATITAAGTYSLSGSLTNGQLVIDATATDKVKILLEEAHISSAGSAPLYVKSAEKVIVYLSPETENSLTDGTSNELEGALYSTANLSLFGTGYFTITGNTDGGLVSESGMIIKNGLYEITAVCSTIKSNTNLVIDGGEYTLAAGNDGIHGEETLTFNGGKILISGSEEGIESSEITINEGTYIELTSTDDGLNASSGDNMSDNHFYMNGGYLYINAFGDGIDSNGYIEMTGGVIVVNGPTANGNGAIDYDKTFNLTGGLLLAVGPSRMGQAPSQSSTQPSVTVTFSSAKQANQLIHIEDENGNEIITFSPAKNYQSLVFSSPSLENGSSYSIYIGGSASGTDTNGLYEGSTYSAGTLSRTFTVSGSLTSVSAN